MNMPISHKLYSISLLMTRIGATLLMDRFGIDMSHFLIMLSLQCEGELSQSQIVNWTGLSKGMVSRIVFALEKQQLVKISTPQDRRYNRVILTATGQELVSAANTVLESEVISKVLHQSGLDIVDLGQKITKLHSSFKNHFKLNN